MPRKKEAIVEEPHVVEHLGTDYVFVVAKDGGKRKYSYAEHGEGFYQLAEGRAKKIGGTLSK